MTLRRPSHLRPVLAAVLVLVMTLAGVGRGVAVASDGTSAGFAIPGVAFHICHTGEGDGSGPADRSRRDCCDDCALLAAATLADAPSMSGPPSLMRYVEHVHAMAWVPTLARLRTPRQSQGPPTA